MKRASNKCGRAVVLVFLAVSLVVPPVEGAVKQAAAETKARAALRKCITRSWVNESIDKVLMDLAEEAGVDIVKSPKVTGNVTAKVTEVPLDEALTNILAAHDYTYIATENMIRVVPVSEIALAREELVSKVYHVTYADANEVAAALRSFVSERGTVAFSRGTSHIVVTDTEKKIKAIDRFIEEVDRKTPQILVEAKVYEITTREGFDLGSALYAANKALEPRGDSLGYPTNVTRTVTPGYTTTTTETRTGRGEPLTYGSYSIPEGWSEWGSEPVGGGVAGTVGTFVVTDREERTTVEIPTVETVETTYQPMSMGLYRRPRGSKPFVGGSFSRVRGGTLTFSLLDKVDLELVLNVLKTQVESKLLANPRILVLDKQTADFKIVREIPYRELRQVARADPITYTEFKDVGVHLKVTPYVTRDGMVKLHVTPEFGILVGQDPNGVPTVDTRRADTVALIKDGQTIAIGGLRKRQTSKEVSKVPVLGDIPLVGTLFRSATELEEINELVVLITPRIITGPGQLEAELGEAGARGIPKAFRRPPEPEPGRRPVEAKLIKPPAEKVAASATQKRSPEVIIRLANAYMKIGRFDRARDTLLSLIEQQPQSNTAHQYLGYCYLKLGEVDKAIQSYYTAIRLNNQDWEAHRGLGVAFMLKGRATNDNALRAKAFEHWRTSLNIKPDQANAEVLKKMIGASRE